MKNCFPILLLLLSSVTIGRAQSKQTDNPMQYRVLKGYLRNHSKGKIAIPDILGYRTLKADLHLHTHQSDGNVSPMFRVLEAYEEGLDAIAITDHQPGSRFNGTTDGNISYNQAVKTAKKHNITLIRGAEVTSEARGPHYKEVGHLNFLFTQDNNRYYPRTPDRDVSPAVADSLLRQAKADSVWVTTNHPGWPDHDSELSQFLIGHIQAGNIQGVEVFNDQEFYPRAIDYLYDYNLAPISATDCHYPIAYRFDLGRAHRDMTLIFARDNSIPAIREAMLARRTVAYADNILVGKQEYVEALLRASVSMDTPTPDADGRIVVSFTNVSDIPYILHDAKTGTTLTIKPLGTTETTCDKRSLKRQWEVLNIYLHPTVHLSVSLSSLVR